MSLPALFSPPFSASSAHSWRPILGKPLAGIVPVRAQDLSVPSSVRSSCSSSMASWPAGSDGPSEPNIQDESDKRLARRIASLAQGGRPPNLTLLRDALALLDSREIGGTRPDGR